MTWVKGSDAAANHPIALAVLAHEAVDDRLLNEVFGFVWRCALQSGCYNTDYVVERGTAIQMAGGVERATFLLEVAEFAGYLTERVEIDGKEAYKLVADKDLFHIRLREEVEWEQQRRRDNANPAVIVPVRWRDGDACRYCGIVVAWVGDRKSKRAGTYDHRVPGEAATIETCVVACQGCNSTRGSDPDALRLLPEPTDPYYSPSTYTWFETNVWAVRHGYVPTRTKTRKVVRSGDIAPGLQTQAPAVSRSRNQRESGTRSDNQSESAGQTTHSVGRPAAAPARPASKMSATENVPAQPDTAPSGPTPSGSHAPRPDNQSVRDQRPGTQPGNATPTRRTPDLQISADPPENGPTSTNTRSADPAGRQGAGSGSGDGSGRDGTGRVGSRSPSPPQRAGPSGSPARRRRRSSRRPT